MPHPEYPRPGMVRTAWKTLNGRWHFTTTDIKTNPPSVFEKEILVPFPVESALSGIGDSINAKELMWYRRTFFIPDAWSGRLVLLHFEASDWETTVYINGKKIGMHRGGYDPFTFDISPYLDERGVQEITVSVWDPTDEYHQPRGKQKLHPKGIWYTPVSGIWQSVWIEPVGLSYFQDVRFTPQVDSKRVIIKTNLEQPLPDDSVRAEVFFKGQRLSMVQFPSDTSTSIQLKNQKLWSPSSPNLYDVAISLIRKGETIDRVSSYFGMRKISIHKDASGYKRIFLNNKPVFQFGLLDQGWWPDGLYTAPTDEALRSDIVRTKEMGYNLIRKHVKIESRRWYYYCDKLGVFVWQDMPNSDKSALWKGPSGIDGKEISRSFASESQYKLEYQAMVRKLYNHPSIVMWVPFNEGWGQFKTKNIYHWAAKQDSTRLYDGPSGGNYFPVGDSRDFHKYPGPAMPPADSARALVLGEFGGLGLPIHEHLWQQNKNWGYRNMKNTKTLEKNYLELIDQLIPLIEKGLAAAIYTQTTDVEGEINGTMTYDRKVIKLKSNRIKKANKRIIDALP